MKWHYCYFFFPLRKVNASGWTVAHRRWWTAADHKRRTWRKQGGELSLSFSPRDWHCNTWAYISSSVSGEDRLHMQGKLQGPQHLDTISFFLFFFPSFSLLSFPSLSCKWYVLCLMIGLGLHICSSTDHKIPSCLLPVFPPVWCLALKL